MKPIQTIGILGGGAWATALAQAMHMAHKKVIMFARNEKVVRDINDTHINSHYLPAVHIDASITASSDVSGLRHCDSVLLAVPAQFIRAECERIKTRVSISASLIICAKGIESNTGKLMADVVKEIFGDNPICVLSGPTFAKEVAQGKPTAVTIAADTLDFAKQLCEQLSSHYFRPYASADIIGVELAGALKNVIAIGCGMVIGKHLGENARTAFMTRGLREMTRLAVALGGKQETLMGLAGLGDLVLTCGSTQSRNMSLGMALGGGERLETILKNRVSVAEGVSTSLAAQLLAKKYHVDTPIIDAVVSVLHHNADIGAMMEQLLSRPLTTE
ncbi:MAG: NAD(P)H-dependent glycerol-3-phosphate dehydrogenase [Alphaproteobacteria bacterium]|nr:NAD(P)H-dependent glycerol-3-phosphate dehydrogenase [Alphaproteobacteria bacterium]